MRERGSDSRAEVVGSGRASEPKSRPCATLFRRLSTKQRSYVSRRLSPQTHAHTLTPAAHAPSPHPCLAPDGENHEEKKVREMRGPARSIAFFFLPHHTTPPFLLTRSSPSPPPPPWPWPWSPRPPSCPRHTTVVAAVAPAPNLSPRASPKAPPERPPGHLVVLVSGRWERETCCRRPPCAAWPRRLLRLAGGQAATGFLA